MWATPDGLRVLKGAERELFLAGTRQLLETCVLAVEDEAAGLGSYFTDSDTGVAVFDTMSPRQRIWGLASALLYLTHEGVASPPPSAWMDATVYAVYRTLLLDVEWEMATVDEDGLVSVETRALIRKAVESLDTENEGAEMDDPVDCWACDLELLADMVLWNRDFEMTQEFLDADPERAALAKAMYGIDQDYFVSCPPEVSDENLELAINFVKSFEKFQLLMSKTI